MCGIAGFVSHKSGHNVDLLLKGIDAIRHRGPDGSGTFVENGVHLGHCRLSIIDLHAHANQPMLSDDKALAIVFNGEIYNYVELRTELEKQGITFKTASDTEVLLKSYEIYGVDCVNKFNGMWSFVIYDAKRGQIFASRDRCGEKPFYYHFNGSDFYFASEIKALIAMGVDCKLDYDYLKSFFFWERYERLDQCNFKGAEQLSGAHSLVFDIATKTLKKWKYYHLESKLTDLSGIRFEDACAEYQLRFKEAVKIRTRSDVPLGLALSGGIDSSLIASELSELARENSIRLPSAINADSETSESSEVDIARASAKILGLPFVRVSAKVDDLLGTILKAHWHQETPSTTMSMIMSWNVYRQFRANNIIVALDGQGGDEIMLGYPRYIAIPVYELLRRGDVLGAIRILRQVSSKNDDLKMGRALRLSAWGWLNSLKLANRLIQSNTRLDVTTVFPPAAQQHLPLRQQVSSQINEIQRATLPGLLRVADRNSMAHGVEARLPFLDPNVVEFAVSLPASVKFEHGLTKAPSRRLLEQHGLGDIANASRKLSFQGPDQQWMAQLGPIPFDYVSRSKVVSGLSRKKMTKEYYESLDHHERWKYFSASIIEEQYGIA